MSTIQTLVDQPHLQDPEYIFREATALDELEDIFRLRYRVITASPLAGFVEKSAAGLDIDSFDTQSRHFGLYHVVGHEQVLVGCQRGVFCHPTSSAPLVREIAARNCCTIQITDAVLPTAAYWPDPGLIERICRDTLTAGQSIAESSRFVLAPEVQNSGLAQSLVESVIATYILASGVAVGLTTVLQHHKLFYRRYGFRQLPGTADTRINRTESAMSCLAITRDSIPSIRLPRLQVLAEQYVRNGFIRLQTGVATPAQVPEAMSHAA